MKKILQILSVIILVHINHSFAQQAGWFWLNPMPQGNDLYSVTFLNTSVGFAVSPAC